MTIAPATIEDIPEILPLINRAFRGDEARKGWTHESDLIDGDIRTDEASLAEIIETEGSFLFKYLNEQHQITGCVHLQQKPRGIYLGMLTVDPDIQGGGIGKKLLAHADEVARTQGCACVFMRVISLRKELIDWYLRHGYVLTGETEPFLVPEKYARPTQPLEFVVLEKKI